jgi:hypothetical protein
MQLPWIPISDTRDKKYCETTFIIFFQQEKLFLVHLQQVYCVFTAVLWTGFDENLSCSLTQRYSLFSL